MGFCNLKKNLNVIVSLNVIVRLCSYGMNQFLSNIK